MLDFYYDFSIDIESKSIKIGIDQKYNMSIFFPDDCNFNPKVTPLENGSYDVGFLNLFKGIDFKFILESSRIKEIIKIWEKKFVKNFSLKYKLENSFLHKEKNEYKVLGKNQTELFSFSNLKIIYEKHNKNTNLDRICNLNVNDIRKTIDYNFDVKDCDDSVFPISIDPTFNFRTRIRKSSNLINNDFDKNNYMIVSGQTIADEFFDDAVGLGSQGNIIGSTPDHEGPYSPEGFEYYKKILSSDDVIFERGCRLMFPYLTDLIENVVVKVNHNGIDTVIGSLPIKSSIVNNIRYDYVDFSFFYFLPSTIQIEALVKLDSDRFGDFSVIYVRTLTLLSEVDLSLDNKKSYITSNENDFSGNVLTLSVLESFKPKRIDLIPFYLDFPTVDAGSSLENIRDSSYRQKDKTFEFKVTPSSIESKSSNIIKYNYDFPNYSFLNWPKVRNYTQFETDNYIMKRGSSQSFYNEAEVLIVSGVNNRSNIEQGTEFRKPYNYISPNDFYFDVDPQEAIVTDGRISLSLNSFNLLTYQKPTHYIKTKNYENKISSIEGIEITYNYSNDETTLDVSDLGDFFVYEFAKSSTPFEAASVEVSYDLSYERPNDTILLKTLENNCLKGNYVLVRKENKLFKKKIKSNTKDKIVFEGNFKDTLKNSNYIGIFTYLPNEAFFVYNNINYDVKNTRLTAVGIVEETGDLEYQEIPLQILPNSPSEIVVNFKENNNNFGGITKKVSIRNETLFYYLGFESSTIKVKASVELTSNTNIEDIVPEKLSIGSGGLLFNSFSIPSKYKNRILYLDIDAPGFADKISLDIYDKEEKITKYTGNVEDILEFKLEDPDENRFLQIRVNQSNIEFSKIIIKFINI